MPNWYTMATLKLNMYSLPGAADHEVVPWCRQVCGSCWCQFLAARGKNRRKQLIRSHVFSCVFHMVSKCIKWSKSIGAGRLFKQCQSHVTAWYTVINSQVVTHVPNILGTFLEPKDLKGARNSEATKLLKSGSGDCSWKIHDVWCAFLQIVFCWDAMREDLIFWYFLSHSY